jgi:hypothetical protein
MNNTKPMTGRVTFSSGTWTVRVVNGIEIGSCPGVPTHASAMAAVAVVTEGSFEFGEFDAEKLELEWSVRPAEGAVSP